MGEPNKSEPTNESDFEARSARFDEGFTGMDESERIEPALEASLERLRSEARTLVSFSEPAKERHIAGVLDALGAEADPDSQTPAEITDLTAHPRAMATWRRRLPAVAAAAAVLVVGGLAIGSSWRNGADDHADVSLQSSDESSADAGSSGQASSESGGAEADSDGSFAGDAAQPESEDPTRESSAESADRYEVTGLGQFENIEDMESALNVAMAMEPPTMGSTKQSTPPTSAGFDAPPSASGTDDAPQLRAEAATRTLESCIGGPVDPLVTQLFQAQLAGDDLLILIRSDSLERTAVRLTDCSTFQI